MALSPEEEEIIEFLRSEQDSYFRGDFEAFVDHWHHGPQVRRILSGPHVGTRANFGWDELKPRFEEGLRQFPQDFDARTLLRWDNVQIQLSGDMAWISYDQVTTRDVPQMHVPPLSHETKIVQRFEGTWKLVCVIVVSPGIEREDVARIELDADGKVVLINELAQQCLTSHQGLAVSGHRLRARNRKYDSELQEAIRLNQERLATSLPRGFQSMEACMVPLGEDDAGHLLFCWVILEQERVLVSFNDAQLLHGRLQKASASFGLSPAQLNLAECLATGHDLSEAAAQLGVSINTVRTQIRRMFEKTQTHSQAALVSRLLSVQGPD